MITRALSEFVSSVTRQHVPDETLRMMQLSLLDWAACGIAGAEEPVARVTRDLVLSEGGYAQAQMFGGGRAPARGAALVNGATSHALDYDDTHFAHIGHPSVAVIPAILAVAEVENLGGAELQMAALVGVEASIRVGVWLGRDHYQSGFHQTGTAGAFGAAAGVAKLLGFDRDQVAAALGLVATRASGLKSQFGTMGKPYNAGIAASNGVEAALLVKGGFEPNPEGLEVAQGFGPTHAGQGQEHTLKGLGQTWLFDTISHKFHACCHGLHATLEALASLNRPAAEEIERIDIRTHPRWMSVCNQPAPTTGLGAKFSYRMVAAMALTGHSTASMDSYTDALCAEPEVVALRERVEVRADNSLSETEAQVLLTLKDGASMAAHHDLDAPIGLEDRETRLQTKAEALIGAKKASQIWSLVTSQAPACEFAGALAP